MKTYLTYTLPIWFAMTVNTLLGMTDMLFLKEINQDFVAVLGLAMLPFTFISMIFVGLGMETNRTMASGKGIPFRRLLAIIIPFSFVICLIVSFFSDYFLFFMRNNPVFDEAKRYFAIYVFTLTPTIILYICTGFFRGKGNSKITLFFSMQAVALNFVLDFIFIKSNFLNDPIVGCALASVLSDLIVAIIYLVYLSKSLGVIRGDVREEVSIKKFLGNAFSLSTEKMFSTSSLLILSGIYISYISTRESSLYYGMERIYAPLLMFVYSDFEWKIYSFSQKIQQNQLYIVRMAYLLISLGIGVFGYYYFNVNSFELIMALFLFICYYFLFFLERDQVAKLFQVEKGKFVNWIVGVKTIAIIVCFQLLVSWGQLNLNTILGTQIILTILAIFVFKKENRELWRQ